MDDYESWTRAEIASAQAKVVELERALAVYLAWRDHRHSSPSPAVNATHRFTSLAPANTGNAPSRHRASKNGAIFAAFEAAGTAGLSQEDVQRVAHEAGLNTNPNALRAFCWTAKKTGRLISLAPGRYAIPPRDEAAPRSPEGNGDAASTRQPNNHHREGDEGGGDMKK